MEFTWIAILASLCMGIGAVLVFVFAVKKKYFENLEDAKYQVFWSDVEELVDLPMRKTAVRKQVAEEQEDDDDAEESRH